MGQTKLNPPERLIKISGDSLKGIIGNPLDDWLKVKVTGASDHPIFGHSVSFQIIAGDGSLGLLNEPMQKIPTDSNGIARTYLTLGATTGRWNHVVKVTTCKHKNQHLTGSPIYFFASAKNSCAESLIVLDGDQQKGKIGALLSKPLTVKVIDSISDPVPGRLCKFKIIRGNAILDSSGLTEKNVKTDADGIASVSVILGPIPGDTILIHADARDGFCRLQGSPHTFTVIPLAEITRIEDTTGSDDSFRLDQNYPNPFNEQTQFRWQLSEPGYIHLSIFSITGQLVKELSHEFQAPGSYSITWDGTDQKGHPAPSGVYWYQLKTEHFLSSKKMILLR